MATATDKLAPRIIINESETTPPEERVRNHPIVLMFGFAPIGRTCEMVVCNTPSEIGQEFGFPVSAPEKWFIDAATKVVQNGATAIMTRLPYDNDQSHTVKYVDFRVESPISMRDIVTVPQETKMREKDDVSVTMLKELHDLDARMNQTQRISLVEDDSGQSIFSMTNDQLVELDLDPQSSLQNGTFRIVDIRGQQYGTGAENVEYDGIFCVITSSPMSLYYNGLVNHDQDMDACLALLDLSQGVETSTDWWRTSDPADDDFKRIQASIVDSIDMVVNVDTTKSRLQRRETFQDSCARRFPRIGMQEKGMLERSHMADVGVMVCGLQWDPDTQKTSIRILESYHGTLSGGRGSVDRQVNSQSRLIRMYRNLSIPSETDFFVCDHQRIASMGMQASQCGKYVNYKTSIMDPVQYMLESVYSDVDSVQIDVVLDGGLSSTAFIAYAAKNSSGETYAENPEVRTRVDWTQGEYPPEEYMQKYAHAWFQTTKMMGDFCKNVRGDCVYIADGPRIMNLEKNYPIANYTDMENLDMFNEFLPYFSGMTNNYVARYWNWVYIEDMQYQNRGFWVPGSVVMGAQLAHNDGIGQPWYAPAGQSRGIVDEAYDVSVRTKQYNSENDVLYSSQWNFFQIYQNEGVVVEGQKTMQTKKTSLDRLNVRRMVCWVKQRLREIANRYKYEPNTQQIRTAFRRDIVEMLSGVQKTSGVSDFNVRCDDTNNSVQTIDRHELWCSIAIRPIKAIEYIVIDLNIINGSIGMNEVVKMAGR